MDFQSVVDQADWLSKTSMTELCLKDTHAVPVINGDEQVKRILGKMPQSIQVLTLPVYTPDTDLFGDPMWKNMPLRSLTVTAMERCPGMTAVRMICKSIRVHTGLQSFTLTDNINTVVTTAEVRHTVQKQLSNLPELNFVNIYGVAVRLVDGKWIDVTK
ncbi:hypothetical protein PAXINDRAFT_97203 [Paxillus involutus ATCC 200175]|nr:hypothetical protein PAXINDRAFT_97203 [Paxillus involutus ATCC 200175]